MSLDAQKELRVPVGSRAFEAGGHRDFVAAVQAIDELWRSQWETGGIKKQPARGSARADGGLTALDENGSEDALISDGNQRRVLSADELRREALCWRCRGFGHLRWLQSPDSPLRSLDTLWA